MKAPRWLLLAGLIAGFSSSAHAQVLVLSGSITGASGIYQNAFPAGDSVRFTLDFTPAYTHGEVFRGVYPGLSFFFALGNLQLAGNDFPFFPEGEWLLLSFRNRAGDEGISLGEGWRSADGIDHGIIQSLLSPNDILPARNQFPGNIPMSAFTNTTGRFESHTYSDASGITFIGQIDWEISSYTGSVSVPVIDDPVPPLSLVPEPATYGLWSGLGLFALIARRMRRAEAA